MKNYSKELEVIASSILNQHASEEGAEKPNYSNRDFMNTILIFQTALMDKMFDNQDFDDMPLEVRGVMVTKCGLELRKLIFTYTGLDTHKFEEFL